MLEEIVLACPYCGESFATLVDCSAGDQRYVEDCQVCCRPIEITINVAEDGKLTGVDTSRDDE
ncbi:CPXCG motif-containing cysteine-rich protein [Ectothiorhodospiraceae bacterium WFHF3C12]|nr:CPXCG motif-containing cysteine-rich protein [Ectothiorhodospiraceae bacterium WFHF3C12]